jgi:CRP/FNR family cyclic AMP-dependent transcriptional regulator
MSLISESCRQPRSRSGFKFIPAPWRESAESLEEITLFASFDPRQRAVVERHCRWRHVQAKEWLFEQNEAGSEVYFLSRGVVRVRMTPSPDCDVILGEIEAGGYFGEMSVLDGLKRSAGILAITEATIGILPAVVFRELVYPHVREQLISRCVSHIRGLNQRVKEFSSMHVSDRIYVELLRQARPHPTDQNKAIVSPAPIHSDIAGRVSTRRETVTRELKLLEQSGRLTKKEGAFVLTNISTFVEQRGAASSAIREDRGRGASGRIRHLALATDRFAPSMSL